MIRRSRPHRAQRRAAAGAQAGSAVRAGRGQLPDQPAGVADAEQCAAVARLAHSRLAVAGADFEPAFPFAQPAARRGPAGGAQRFAVVGAGGFDGGSGTAGADHAGGFVAAPADRFPVRPRRWRRRASAAGAGLPAGGVAVPAVLAHRCPVRVVGPDRVASTAAPAHFGLPASCAPRTNPAALGPLRQGCRGLLAVDAGGHHDRVSRLVQREREPDEDSGHVGAS